MSGKVEKQSIGSFPEIKNKQVKIISIDKRNQRQKKKTKKTTDNSFVCLAQSISTITFFQKLCPYLLYPCGKYEVPTKPIFS